MTDPTANVTMYHGRSGALVQVALGQDELNALLATVDTTIETMLARGYNPTDPQQVVVQAHQRATELAANPDEGEEEESADLWMAVLQNTGQIMIALYNSQFGRNFRIGVVYDQKRKTLPWDLNTDAVKKYESENPIKKDKALEQGYLQPFPGNCTLVYVRKLRESKNPEKMNSKPYDRTVDVLNANGVSIPWTPFGQSAETPNSTPPARLSPGQTAPSNTAVNTTATPTNQSDRDLWDTKHDGPIKPTTTATIVQDPKLELEREYMRLITFKFDPPQITLPGYNHINDPISQYLVEGWMRQTHAKPGIKDYHDIPLVDLQSIIDKLKDEVVGPTLVAAYNKHKLKREQAAQKAKAA